MVDNEAARSAETASSAASSATSSSASSRESYLANTDLASLEEGDAKYKYLSYGEEGVTHLPIRFRHRCQRKMSPKKLQAKMRTDGITREVKIFGASVECQEDKYDPETTNVLKVSLGEPTAIRPMEADLLSRYVEDAQANSKRFYSAADRNRKWKNWTNFFLYIIAALTAGGSTLYNLFHPSEANETHHAFAFRITVNILLVIGLILKGLQQTFKYREKSTNYEMVADDYNNYAREWIMRIAQGVDDRRDKCLEALRLAQHSLREIELGALPLLN